MKPHDSTQNRRRLAWAMGITSLVLVAEVVGGLWTGSLALLSDAAHVFTDIFALGLSLLALRLAALPADDQHTYGYHRLEVLAALVNGITLVVISGGILLEAYRRWANPQPVKSTEMMVIAIVGLVANLAVALILRHGHAESEHDHLREDVNLHSAFLHVAGDAISSVGVIIAAILIGLTGQAWLDPLVSALIGVIILVSAVRVLRVSLHILVEGVPFGLDLRQVNAALLDQQGVSEVHDLHVWSICSGHVALSAHVVLADDGDDPARVMARLKQRLMDGFGIEHTTIQFEGDACGQGRSTGLQAAARPTHGD